MEWYNMTLPEVGEQCKHSLEQGLSEKEAAHLEKKYGRNELLTQKGPSFLTLFFSQFKDFMIITLLAAAAISFFASYTKGEIDWADPCIILAIVLTNAFIGIYQERKAEHSLEALRSMQTPVADVTRDGVLMRIPSSNLVPGDIVHLHAGSLVPADGRLIDCHSLSTDESSLTGETNAIHKNSEPLFGKNIPSADQRNMVFSGSTVQTGRGTFLVCKTGMHTEIGQIAGMLSAETAPDTPLTKRLNHTGKLLGTIALLICVIIFFMGLQKKQPIFSMFMTSVSLGVAAIPESLPALVTIMLSLGVERMARKKAVIRHLPAVETLGSASVICSDKTGTLTENKMTVRDYYTTADLKYMLTLFVLCNDNSGAMEQAIISYAEENKIAYKKEQELSPRIFEIPFDSSRKKMTTLHKTSSGFLSITKGAPELLLAAATHYDENGHSLPMTRTKRHDLQLKAEEFASRALRVLAVAYQLPSSQKQDETLEQNLIFAGFVGLMDPPRKEAYDAVKKCKAAGILPVMITGDHRITAAAIGRELGICHSDSEVITGRELDLMSETELSSRLNHYHVFARVSPAHKVRLVHQYQQHGNVVAMTGDGVNDAPALKAADIGCSMGLSGTDVAKNASDMILMDDNFSTIVSAVREGRSIYDNIKKAIHFLLSCNIGEIMTIFVAILFGLEVPLLPVQLLFINLVTDSFPALCLGVEPPDPDIMNQPPQKAGKSMFQFSSVFQILVEGMFIGSLALFAYVVGNSTMCFAVLSLSQLVHSLNMRSQHSLLKIGFGGNKKLLISLLLCAILQCSVISVPALQMIFHTTGLTTFQWGIVAVLSLLPIPLVELEKRIH